MIKLKYYFYQSAFNFFQDAIFLATMMISQKMLLVTLYGSMSQAVHRIISEVHWLLGMTDPFTMKKGVAPLPGNLHALWH